MKPLLLALTLLNCGDSITTHAALSIGAREANPFTSNPIVLDVARTAETATLWAAAPRAAKSHPKLTKGLLIGAVALQSVVVASNIRQMQRQR